LISPAIRAQVRTRARDCCEFCGLGQERELFFTFHVEHIIARQHRGADDLENLALACYHCNLHKGTNLTSLDPQTGELTALFHPRLQRWSDHFLMNGTLVTGTSAVGRTTVALLKMNAPDRRRLRET
jgi:hypothetical protein